jgi:hypothetical protein
VVSDHRRSPSSRIAAAVAFTHAITPSTSAATATIEAVNGPYENADVEAMSK